MPESLPTSSPGFAGKQKKSIRTHFPYLKEVQFDFAYMFAYSERPGTLAHKKYKDDVPEEIKKFPVAGSDRITAGTFRHKNKERIRENSPLLIEGVSKKSKDRMYRKEFPEFGCCISKGDHKKEIFVNVKATACTAGNFDREVIGLRVNNNSMCFSS